MAIYSSSVSVQFIARNYRQRKETLSSDTALKLLLHHSALSNFYQNKIYSPRYRWYWNISSCITGYSGKVWRKTIVDAVNNKREIKASLLIQLKIRTREDTYFGHVDVVENTNDDFGKESITEVCSASQVWIPMAISVLSVINCVPNRFLILCDLVSSSSTWG